MYTNPQDIARDQALADRGLPEIAFIDNPHGVYGSAPVIAVKRGETGYHPIHTRASADDLNGNTCTPAQREAMLFGSIFGWHTQGSSPSFHAQMMARKAARCAQSD